MTEERARLLLGGHGLAPLVDRVAQRMRRGRPLTGTIVLAALGPAEHAALAGLLGRPIASGSTLAVRLEEVDRIVRDSGAAPDLAAAITLLRGPIVVTADAATLEQQRWDAAFAPLESFAARRPEFARLAPYLRSTGLLKIGGGSAASAAAGMRDLVTVLDALPTSGETLAAFSARVLHSAHALDRGKLRALVALALDQLAEEPADDDEEPADPAERWTAVGIAFDSLASSVLVHGLRFDPAEPVGAALDALFSTGQPVLVTLRMLLAGARPVPDEVFVCENPAVLIASADRYGSAAAPIVCVRGQPSAAAQRLLRLLADAGATLRYHGDFDWGGLRIANRIVERYGAVPWRYSVEDLMAAAVPGDDLAGDRVEASWDPDLADAIEARDMRLEEEQVLGTLLPDLAR